MWVATVCHAFYNFFFQTFWLHLLFKQPGPNVKYWEVLGAEWVEGIDGPLYKNEGWLPQV